MSSEFDKFLSAPKNSEKTSHTEVEAFTKCERFHYYGYGLKLKSKHPSEALVRGNIGHEYLARYYEYIMHGMPVEEAGPSTLEDLTTYIANHADDPNLATIGEVYYLLDEYFKHYEERDKEIEVLAVEQEFNIPIGPDYHMKLFVDLIARMPNKGIVVWDHKFVYNFFDSETESVLGQLPKYLGALKSVGYNVTGAMYNEIRHRTTAENREDPSKRFQRGFVDINKERVMQTMREQIAVAKRIKALKDSGIEEWDKSVVRAANSNICRNCPFIQICGADLRGDDTTLMQEYNYAKKDAGQNG